MVAEGVRGVKTKGAASPKILRLDHLVLTCADVAATCAFYARVFGFEIVESKAGTWMQFGAQKINLYQRGEETKPHAQAPTPGSADLCFTTKMSVAELERHFEVEGVAVELGPVDRKGAKGAIESMYVRDPDGNLLEIARYKD